MPSIADSTSSTTTATGLVPETAPLLFQRREAIVVDGRRRSTTDCQTTMASDWTPDD